MTTVYCIRHAQSTANAGGVTMEHAAIPLSALGVRQAAALPGFFDVRPSRVLASSYVRAIQTAGPYCAQHGCEVEIHPLLHEFSALDANELQGMVGAQRRPLADAYWQAANPALRSGPGAEAFFEFAARVAAFAEILPALPDRSVLFGHGIWFALLFWTLQGSPTATSQDMASFRRFQLQLPMPNCAVYALRRQPGLNGWDRCFDEQVARSIAEAAVCSTG